MIYTCKVGDSCKIDKKLLHGSSQDTFFLFNFLNSAQTKVIALSKLQKIQRKRENYIIAITTHCGATNDMFKQFKVRRNRVA